MKTKNERSEKAQTLISAFNVLWNQSLKNGELTYVDMVRISDIIKHEGSKILEEPDLPKIIHSGLLYAQASVDPNKERSKATMKKAASLVGGTGGLALISVAVGALVAPSKWAIVVAFFMGGIPGGPLALITGSIGLLLVVGAVYMALQKKTPAERASHAHKCFMKSVDVWIDKGNPN